MSGYSTGLCACLDDKPSVIDSLCCYPCQIGFQFGAVNGNGDQMSIMHCLLSAIGAFQCCICLIRRNIDERYNIGEGCCVSLCIAYLFPWCSLCQTHRELKNRGAAPSGICIKVLGGAAGMAGGLGGSQEKIIDVGSSDSNTKNVSAPPGHVFISCDPTPQNKQEAGWGDRFDVQVHKDYIVVRRLDQAIGWGQGLQLKAVVAMPQEKVVDVGPSDSNTKVVRVEGVVECSATPANPQEAGWGDRFNVVVRPNEIAVTRTDQSIGWGQGLQLKAKVAQGFSHP